MPKRKLPPPPPEVPPTKKEALRLAEIGCLEVGAIQCPSCFDIVFSRAHHDMRYCTCGSVAIDGGREYAQITFTDVKPINLKTILIPFTAKELYDDWNAGRNELGIIRVQEFARLKRKKRH